MTPKQRLLDHAFGIFKSKGNQTVVEWAEANAYLSERVTELAGPYRTTDHPYVREVLENWRDPKTKKVSLVLGIPDCKDNFDICGPGLRHRSVPWSDPLGLVE